MALKSPPIQDTVQNELGVFEQRWIKWLRSIKRCFDDHETRIEALEGGGVSIDNEGYIAEAINEISTVYGDTVSAEAKAKRLEKWGTNEAVGTSKAVIMTMKSGIDEETMLTSNGITTVVSDSTSDTGGIEIDTYEGHDWNSGSLLFTIENTNVALTGQTAVTLPTALARATRARLTEPCVGNVYFYEGGAISSGVPTNGDQIHLIIPAGEIQTQKAATSISATDYWIINEAEVSVLEKTSSWAQFRLEVKPASGANNSWYPITGWVSASDASGSVNFFSNGGYSIVPKNHDVRMVAIANTSGVFCAARFAGPLASVQ